MSDSLQPQGLYSPWNSPGQNTGVGSLSLLQGFFPTQESNWGLLHCRWILYQLSHKGSARILEWVPNPFSRGSSQPRDQTQSLLHLLSWQVGSLSLVPPGKPTVGPCRLFSIYSEGRASLVAQLVKNPPAMQETWVLSLGWEDPLEEGKATHSSILAWRIPWTDGPWGRKESDTTE